MYYYIFAYNGNEYPSYWTENYQIALRCAAQYFEVDEVECQLIETDDEEAAFEFGGKDCVLTSESAGYPDADDDFWLPEFSL